MSEKFEDFQLEEYKNISNAHFEANKQIEVFFRYFLLIASAPAALVVWFGKDETFLEKILDGRNVHLTLFASFFLILISLIGLFSCFYLISFRLDSVLYARTINGIRKYFYHNKNLKYESQYRVLPKQTNQPKYRQTHTFSIIVYCFALINSAFFSLGTRILASVGTIFFSDYLPLPILIKNYNFLWTLGCFILAFSVHIIYYRFITNYRNYSYMKTLTIGIDIDGVLNKQRETFCTVLWEKTGKTLWAKDIFKIPVNLMKTGITRTDESLVFNDPTYWKRNVIYQSNLCSIIEEFKNRFGYKINIFSYRPWPELAFLPKEKHETTLNEWWGIASKFKKFPKWIQKSKIFYKYYNQTLKFRSITKITKKWLKDNGISYNNLLVEKAGIDVESAKFNLFRIPKSNYQNRFYYSRKDSYRYFVEDDLKNAVKLAANCEYVFLMDHPYNQILEGEIFPSNIIRVNDWNEIKEHIQDLG